ncbi:MAG: 4'-phosphopantetheinyl transferase family protein [Lawsonibacter sp.]
MEVYVAVCSPARQRAYEVLAEAAARTWGISPLPEVARQKGGKPYFSAHPCWEFNLSHSGEMVFCALDEKPVGADIQVVRQLRPNMPIRVCSSEELEWLRKGADQWERFTLLWTLKESRVKYTGTGLRQPIPSIRVPLPETEEALACQDGLFFRIYRGQGWYAAVCGETPPPERVKWLNL